MALPCEQVLLRVHVQSADRAPRTPTWERIVSAALREGLGGATVLKGIHGASGSTLLWASAMSFVEHAPVIVEVVDEAERIGAFVNGALGRLMEEGFLTLERAHVMRGRREPGALRLGGTVQPLSNLPQVQARPHMSIHDDGVLLRIFIGEADRLEKTPLYEAIVAKARALGLAGATVLRGIEGFGASSVVRKSAVLGLSGDLPIVIEIVDQAQRVEALLPHLDGMVRDGMITMEHVRIVAYRAGG